MTKDLRHGLERPRFFQGQLITPADLTQIEDYFIAWRRRHNRLLHGWGVVAGGWVSQDPADGARVVITPLFCLSPQGDEIIIEQPVSIDVRTEGVSDMGPCTDPSDPWCAEVRVQRSAGQTLYLAVRYAERPAQPVRAPAVGCGLDVGSEYSRLSDGYVIDVLTSRPASYGAALAPPDLARSLGGVPAAPPLLLDPRPLPDPIDDPWVILATVTLNADATAIAAIDNTSARRFVAAFGAYFFVSP
jgi:hypothetical protein